MTSSDSSKIVKYAVIAACSAALVAGAATYFIKSRNGKSKGKAEKSAKKASKKQAVKEDSASPIEEIEDKEKVRIGQELRAKGNSLFKECKYEKAIECYSEAIRAFPATSKEIALCYGNRAACYTNLNKPEEVILDCTKALEISPLYVKALERRARTYEALGRLEEAIVDATTACLADEFKNDAISKKAESILKALGDKKANELLKERSFRLPSLITIQDYLNSFPTADMNVSMSKAEIEENIKNQSNLGDSFLYLGKLNIKDGKFTEAMAYFEKAVENAPTDISDAFHWLATFVFLTGDAARAVELFTKSIEANAKNSTSIMKRALIRLEQGDFGALMEDLEAAVKVNSRDPSISYHRGELMALSSDFEQAIKEYDNAIQLCPKFMNAYSHKSKAYLSMQMLPEAKATLMTALKKFPKSAELLCALGEVFIFEQNFDEALRKFDESIAINQNYAPNYVGKAMLFMGDLKKTEEILKQALEADPQFITAHLQLANVYMTSEKSDKAMHHFDRAIESTRTFNELSSVVALKEASIAQIVVSKRHPELAEVIKRMTEMPQ